MIRKKILVIATYPITKPEHGGQKRVRAIVDFYTGIFRQVKFIGVYHRAYFNDGSPDDLLLGDPEIIKKADQNPAANELVQGEAISSDIHVRSYIAEVLKNFDPDIIEVEQGYPYLGLAPLLKELNIKAKIIFSSQNVEYKMKEQIFKDLGMPAKESAILVEKIKGLEERLCREADLVVAVSPSDAEVFKSMGAKNIVIAPNGISSVSPSAKSISFWKSYKQREGIDHILLFVGSAHPPNWKGFLEMIGMDTDFLPPRTKILVAGGVSDYLKANLPETDKNFWKNVVALGKISEDKLAGLVAASDLILLPITSGGGSNLKTAEAILADKKIVATEYAFRGFDKYKRLPNLYLAASKAEFQQAISRALEDKKIVRNRQQEVLAAQVQWHYCLVPLSKQLKGLLIKDAAGKTIRKLVRQPMKVKKLLRGH